MTEHQIKTPKRRFKGFTGEWEREYLKDLGIFSKGSGISKTDLSDEGYSCVLYGELYTKYNEVIKDVQSKTNIELNNPVIGKVNDILIPSSGETAIDIATASCLQVDGVLLGGDLNIFRPHNVNGIFLSYQLGSSKKMEIAKMAQGASVVHVYNEQLKDLVVDIPSLQEQQKIGEFFSQLDERIELQKSKVGKMTELKKAYLSEMFPAEGETTPKRRFKGFTGEWEEVKLGEVVNFTNGTAHENIIDKKGNFIVVNSKFISTSGREFKKSKESLCSLYKDDIVLVMSDVPNGKALAKCFFIDKDNTYTLNQRICALTAIDIHSKFLFYIVNRNKYFLEFDNGVGQTNLKKEDVLNCPLMIPNKEEQIKISEFFSELDEMIELHEEKLKKLQDLKQAYLNELLI